MPFESTSVTCAMISAASVWSSTVTRSDAPAPVPCTTCPGAEASAKAAAAAVDATATTTARMIAIFFISFPRYQP
jgi:hypothetical protein